MSVLRLALIATLLACALAQDPPAAAPPAAAPEPAAEPAPEPAAEPEASSELPGWKGYLNPPKESSRAADKWIWTIDEKGDTPYMWIAIACSAAWALIVCVGCSIAIKNIRADVTERASQIGSQKKEGEEKPLIG